VSTDELLTARRQRYEALKMSGQAPKRLPGPSAVPAPDVPQEALIHREVIPGGWYWCSHLKSGETLRLQTLELPSAVSLLAWNRNDTSERINYADTVKVQWTAALGKGRVIFSDMGRVMFSIVEDSAGAHDALVGGSTASSNSRRYADGPHRNTRDNFLLAAQKLGLDARDIPPCLTFFAPVRTDEEGRFVWDGARRRAGDFVDLRAEMDLLVALSNCPHPLDPAADYAPSPVAAVRFSAAPPSADDLCRTATDEARRGFENNAALAL
jgi:uncharacterized protein